MVGQVLLLAFEKYSINFLFDVSNRRFWLVTLLFVAINMLVDLAYGWLDPRVKLSSAN